MSAQCQQTQHYGVSPLGLASLVYRCRKPRPLQQEEQKITTCGKALWPVIIDRVESTSKRY